MNDYVIALVVGAVEGLTEFLPVSSTAHIRIAQRLLGVRADDGFWKFFAIAIQFPAILAVVIYFRRRLLDFARSWFEGGLTRAKFTTHPVALVALAFAVTAVPVFLLKKVVKGNLENFTVMGWALVTGGVVMWAVDAYFGRRERSAEPAHREGDELEVERARPAPAGSTEAMKPWQAAWIGAVQILSALFPGTSRSMSTIVAGQLAGLSRAAALEFSFFVSIPIMAAAFADDLRDALTAGTGDESYVAGGLTGERWAILGVGSLTSFVVAYAVIAWFMAWVKRRGFAPFAVWRIVVGALILWFYAGS